ncbi:MAG TPA: SRPBCC family protein [Kofleriaceae bacterium]
MRSMTPLALDEFDAQPFRFTATAKLDADPIAVFAELGDPSLWFPLMTRSVWKTGATSGVGAEREVNVRTFGKFRERMLAWDTGERVAFTMTGSTSPLMECMGEDMRISREDIFTRLDWIVVGKPTLLGRVAAPALRAILRVIFIRAAGNIQKRAGTFKRERAKEVS